MEIAGLERVHFEHAFFFTFCLDDLDCHVGFVHYHVPGLEFNDLREAEGIRQILNVGNNLVHAISAVLSASVLQEDGFSLQSCHIEWKVCPI